jgi:glycosyltransferase involved in cell wall biosynthesis
MMASSDIWSIKMSKILSFNAHTGYHYLLSKTGLEFDICGKWDKDERPIPENFTIISLDQAIVNLKEGKYSVILTHARKDLFIVLKHINRSIQAKVIYVFHGRYQRTGTSGGKLYKFAKFGYKQILKIIKNMYNIKFVFISPCIKVSWGIDGFVITPGIDINDFKESDYSVNKLLVVGNNLHRHYFKFNLLRDIIGKLPISVVGYNPLIEIAKKARNFSELIEYSSRHRAYLYLADEPEEGFNLSLLEAMASGLPVITMFHPTSPIIHGYNGLVAFNEKEYLDYCKLILNDMDLAKQLGKNARYTARVQFSIDEFIRKWKFIISNGI